ncbi:MAG: Gfo/Idh/MocA family oxidoreductase [Mariniphaga sp.]|nr:Gfo/Idh/MocA family oxidoreductase [Mariniphaga sp.]
MSKKKTKKYIAIIGTGYWGKNLVRNFYQLGVLKTICDLDKNILKKFEKLYPDTETTQNIRKILLDKKIKGVVISTPAITHYELTKKCLLAGKNVLVEKPLTLDLIQAKKLIKLAQDKKRVLMVGHLLHYHPAIIRLKQLVKNGVLGKIQYVYSNRLNFGKLRTEENILLSFAPHDISVILSLFEKLPKKVATHGMSWLKKGIADTTISYFEFNKKQGAHIFVSWLNPFKEQKLVVVGDKKMAVFDDREKNKLTTYSHKIKWDYNKMPTAKQAPSKIISISPSEPLREECQHFLNCIKTRKNPRTDGKESLNVLKTLTACQKSLDNKGKTINL